MFLENNKFLPTPDDLPSGAKDRTESSGFRRCGSSLAWNRGVRLFHHISVLVQFVKHNSIILYLGHWIHLLVVPELPSHILCPGKKCTSELNQMNRTNNVSPCNEFAFPSPIHEGSELLNEVVKTLGALVEELVDKLARLAEVRQLVEVAVILGVGGGDHLEEKISKILDVFLEEQLSQ